MVSLNKPVELKPKEEALAKLRGWRSKVLARLELKASGETSCPEDVTIMPDGTIFTGLSPDTGKPMYATPQDAGITMNFNQAAAYVDELNKTKAYGHDDWRLPSKEELRHLFGMQHTGALSGTFTHQARRPFNTANMYWSSSVPTDSLRRGNNVFCLTFNGIGTHQLYFPNGLLSVRCVR